MQPLCLAACCGRLCFVPMFQPCTNTPLAIENKHRPEAVVREDEATGTDTKTKTGSLISEIKTTGRSFVTGSLAPISYIHPPLADDSQGNTYLQTSVQSTYEEHTHTHTHESGLPWSR
jgi:hypothetical protein